MDQTFINWLLCGFGALLGFIMNTIWSSIKELQKSDKDIVEKIGEIEVLVAGDYVKRSELSASMEMLFVKLDKIEGKIDKKADK